MKFLDSEKLDSLSSLLSFESNDYRLETKIEMYSCKMVNHDKRLFKEMLRAEGPTASGSDLQALSPPVHDDPPFPANFSPSSGSIGYGVRQVSCSSDAGSEEKDSSMPVLCDAINHKRLFDLISVLNASFPDYDFSGAKGENFSKVSSFDILKRLIDGKYLSVALKSHAAVQSQLWAVIDGLIDLQHCRFYTYNPDYESDPYSEDGCIWSFNYFFYNPAMKRVLFFTCRAFSIQATASSGAEKEWSLEDM